MYEFQKLNIVFVEIIEEFLILLSWAKQFFLEILNFSLTVKPICKKITLYVKLISTIAVLVYACLYLLVKCLSTRNRYVFDLSKYLVQANEKNLTIKQWTLLKKIFTSRLKTDQNILIHFIWSCCFKNLKIFILTFKHLCLQTFQMQCNRQYPNWLFSCNMWGDAKQNLKTGEYNAIQVKRQECWQ